jgi:hypothetical protein
LVATYFDATSTADKALIVASLRGHADLPTVAEQAEWDVIEHFTRQFPAAVDHVNNFYVGRGYHRGNGVYVALEGFQPDADAVESAYQELKTALKWTIADVISWRLSKYGESPIVSSISPQNGPSKSFRDEVKSDFPPGQWERRVKRWDIRLTVYSI